MNHYRFSAADLRIVWALLAFIVILMIMPLAMSADSLNFTFSEDGPFEIISPFVWVFAALLVLYRMKPMTPSAWAFFIGFLIFAAREADLHKKFTADGMLKINYYKHAVAPLTEKLIAGAVALTLVIGLLCMGYVILRFLFLKNGWRTRAGFFLIVSVALMVLTKIVDRAPNVLEVDYGIMVEPLLRRIALAYEEGLETITPLVFAWSVWIGRDERHYLAGVR